MGVAGSYQRAYAGVNGAGGGGGGELALGRKGRGVGRPNGTVRVDLAFTDRSIRQLNLKSRIEN